MTQQCQGKPVDRNNWLRSPRDKHGDAKQEHREPRPRRRDGVAVVRIVEIAPPKEPTTSPILPLNKRPAAAPPPRLRLRNRVPVNVLPPPPKALVSSVAGGISSRSRHRESLAVRSLARRLARPGRRCECAELPATYGLYTPSVPPGALPFRSCSAAPFAHRSIAAGRPGCPQLTSLPSDPRRKPSCRCASNPGACLDDTLTNLPRPRKRREDPLLQPSRPWHPAGEETSRWWCEYGPSTAEKRNAMQNALWK